MFSGLGNFVVDVIFRVRAVVKLFVQVLFDFRYEM